MLQHTRKRRANGGGSCRFFFSLYLTVIVIQPLELFIRHEMGCNELFLDWHQGHCLESKVLPAIQVFFIKLFWDDSQQRLDSNSKLSWQVESRLVRHEHSLLEVGRARMVSKRNSVRPLMDSKKAPDAMAFRFIIHNVSPTIQSCA